MRGPILQALLEERFRLMGRPVVDKTGISGLFDFHLEFAPDECTPSLLLLPPGALQSPATASDPVGPSIFTAFPEQLGLKLEPARGAGEFLVIDSVEAVGGLE